MKLPSFLQWRYDVYLSEHIDLYGSLVFYIKQKINNCKQIRKAKVAYIYANKRNVGDYISFLGIKSLIDEPGAELFCSPVWQQQFNRAIADIKQHNPDCLLIIGGGGLLQPVFKPFWETVLASGLKFVLFGIGINKMPGRPELDDSFLQTVIERAELIRVRDNYTEQQIQNLHSCETSVGICPSVSYVNSRYFGSEGQSNVLLHMYHPSDLRLKGVDFGRLRATLIELAKAMGLVYQEHSNITSDYKSMLLALSQAKIVVSSRLHGCIMSYSSGVPFIPLYCDEKIQSFVETHTSVRGVEPADMYDLDFALNALKQALVNNRSEQVKINQQITQNKAFVKSVKGLIC